MILSVIESEKSDVNILNYIAGSNDSSQNCVKI